MGRRYGRNQKRTHRQAIKDLSLSLHQHNQRSACIQAELKEARSALDYVIEAVGRDSVLNSPRWVMAQDTGNNIVHVIVQEELQVSGNFSAINSTSAKVATLYKLMTQAKVDTWRNLLHVRADLGYGRAAYSMDLNTVNHLSAAQLARRIQAELAPIMAVSLTQALREHHQRHR